MGRGRVRGGGGGRGRGGVVRERRGRGRGGVVRERRGSGIPVSNVVSAPYTNSVCVGMEVSCKQS